MQPIVRRRGEKFIMYVVSETEARQIVTLDDAIEVMDQAFRALDRGDVVSFPPLAAHGSAASSKFGVKAAVDKAAAIPGLKIGSYWPDNLQQGIPAHGSTTILLDDRTGLPSALVAASHINGLRTAAADAVGVRALSAPHAGRVAIVGAGHQAYYDLQAIARVREVTDVQVWSRSPERAAAFAKQAREEGFNAAPAELEAAVRGADIVVTATASHAALIQREWVSAGTHISAMGADGQGKQELDPALVANALLFADLPEQSVRIGEFQHAASLGLIDPSSIVPIGAVLNGHAPGRTDPEQITIFDSSGIGIQDIAIAGFVVEQARKMGLGTEVDLG